MKKKSSVRILLLRRQHLLVLAALVLAGGIFWVVSWPAAAVTATATQRQLPIYSVDREEKICSISFDAAWGNEDTQILIDILGKYNVKATFFVVGDWAEKYPESAKALADAGHEVMSHSLHHDHYNSLTADQILSDLAAANEKLCAATGTTPALTRCPAGNTSTT